MATPSPARTPAALTSGRYIDLGGEAVHIFHFKAPPAHAYQYFCDVPAVFSQLPDALDVYAYGPDRYRLIVGASDGHGHTMSAIFDLLALHEPGRAIRIVPTEDGPPPNLPGMVFGGALSAEAVFKAHATGTVVEYHVDIAMAIPVPAVLRLMPLSLLQGIGERAMEFKMSQMISGFTRSISADFNAWYGA